MESLTEGSFTVKGTLIFDIGLLKVVYSNEELKEVRMKKRFLVGVVFLSLVFSAISGYFSKALNYIYMARVSLQRGNSQKAVEYLNLALMEIKNNSPLVIKNVRLCYRINGFRDFLPRPGSTLRRGEPLLLYFEVDNFGVKERYGEYYINVSEDVRLVNEKGQAMFQRKNWTVVRKGFPSPNIPLYFQNKLTGIPPGRYKFEITINDNIKRTFAVKTYYFEVR